ncbi:hypothetical protein E3J62_11610 [candidate division TA06 bacterium]|uniref:Pilus assembly protein PilP n=1 Tax=candidate division TA06 bacterium TaxID=2250710 RepID=A0A523UN85_UNCT6|nr:MAG: hypothetical protein E3J62_11610 [candidate division TA06 bacterium]
MRRIFILIAVLIFGSGSALLCQESGEETPSESTLSTALDESLEVELPFEREFYHYDKIGRRDPFLPLVPKEDVTVPSINNLVLMGIIWGYAGKVAVIKERGGVGYVMRERDEVAGGSVGRITTDSITFVLEEFGVVSEYTLTLKGQGRR